jgi:hypothetical protein
VPTDAGAAKVAKYSAPARQAAIRHLLAEATLVYLSTNRLRRQLAGAGYLRLAVPVYVGKVASATEPLPMLETVPARPAVFGYMASSSHELDLALALPGVVAALERDAALSFEIYGSLALPARLQRRFGPRVRWIPPVPDYDAFLARLRELRWAWGLAPLRPGRFQDAKCETKWV